MDRAGTDAVGTPQSSTSTPSSTTGDDFLEVTTQLQKKARREESDDTTDADLPLPPSLLFKSISASDGESSDSMDWSSVKANEATDEVFTPVPVTSGDVQIESNPVSAPPVEATVLSALSVDAASPPAKASVTTTVKVNDHEEIDFCADDDDNDDSGTVHVADHHRQGLIHVAQTAVSFGSK